MQFIWQAWAKEKKKEEIKKNRVEVEKSQKTQKGSGISEVSPCIPAGTAWEFQRPLYGLNIVAGTPQQNEVEASKRITMAKILNWWSRVSKAAQGNSCCLLSSSADLCGMQSSGMTAETQG